jgi:hypothetical protein
MQRSSVELWLAFFAILILSIIYLSVILFLGGIPPARELFGHSLGIVGFMMMLMTETLYSLRKRSRSARWGRMSTWLQFHIFTGIVGPFLVLLHSSWKFNGLAGLVLLMTGLVVFSGFLGRYIYTAVPRTADGIEIEATELQRLIGATESQLQRWVGSQPARSPLVNRRLAGLTRGTESSIYFGLGNAVEILSNRFSWWVEKRRIDPTTRRQIAQLETLLIRRRLLRRQIASYAQARRLLALWHMIHIPIGLALFTAAFIHVGAAIYYATLLR